MQSCPSWLYCYNCDQPAPSAAEEKEREFLTVKWKESFNWINSKDWDTISQCNERLQDVLMAGLLLLLEPAWYLSILIRVGEAADRIWHQPPIPTSLCFQGSKISCQIWDFSLGDNLPRGRLSTPTPPHHHHCHDPALLKHIISYRTCKP